MEWIHLQYKNLFLTKEKRIFNYIIKFATEEMNFFNKLMNLQQNKNEQKRILTKQ